MSDKCTKIMLIEDNPGDARLIQEMLAEAEPGGFDLEHADRLFAGIKRLDRGNVDVILLDLDLPDSQGVDTFTKVYAQARKTPIVVFTGVVDKAVGIKAVRGGAQDYLVKGQVDGNLISRAIHYAIERKQSEEALKESEGRYRLLADNVTDIIFTMDMNLRFTYVSPSVISLTGYSVEEVMALVLEEVVTPTSFEVAMKAFAEELATENMEQKDLSRSRTLQLELKRKDGSTVWAEVTTTFLRGPHGQAIEILGVTRDITERKQMELELREKNEQLDAQNEELQSQAEELAAQQQELVGKTREVERANKLKSEFLSNMSHELRTPLNVIMGFSQLMVDEVPGEINEEQKQCLSDILNSSQRLLNLINGVLDLSKIESGKMELKLGKLALAEVVGSLARIVMPLLAPRQQSLDIEIEEGLPPVYADEGKLEQVLLNLVDNSSKFTPDGGKLKIEVVRDGDWCQVSVIDNGIGIKAEDKERLFEPFCRLDSPLSEEKPGTGLGLALVKQIVGRNGGRIWVESEYGEGSRFTFTLPLATGS